jgi:hypothetical protein
VSGPEDAILATFETPYWRLSEETSSAAKKATAALRAVLDLRPPQTDGEDTKTVALMDDGWWTCHSTVVRAIAEKLTGGDH